MIRSLSYNFVCSYFLERFQGLEITALEGTNPSLLGNSAQRQTVNYDYI